jgi:hypothetical protein
MFAKAKGIGIAALVLLCTLSLMGSRANLPPRPRAGAALPPAGGAGVVPVLVEAFVVEVNLPALAGLDVSPIGQEPHAIAVADILKCLGTGQARVIGGGKAVSQSEARTGVEATETTYVSLPAGTPPETRSNFNSYQATKKFNVGINWVSETAVSVQFSIAQTQFLRAARTAEVPPATESWSWSSGTTLELGKPQIVGATQDSKTAVFLILTAHIQSE